MRKELKVNNRIVNVVAFVENINISVIFHYNDWMMMFHGGFFLYDHEYHVVPNGL
jgi:hypothetical protein